MLLPALYYTSLSIVPYYSQHCTILLPALYYTSLSIVLYYTQHCTTLLLALCYTTPRANVVKFREVLVIFDQLPGYTPKIQLVKQYCRIHCIWIWKVSSNTWYRTLPIFQNPRSLKSHTDFQILENSSVSYLNCHLNDSIWRTDSWL